MNLSLIYLISFSFFCFLHPMLGWLPGSDVYFAFLMPIFPLITCTSILFIILSGYNLRTAIGQSLTLNRWPLSSGIKKLIKIFIFFIFLDAAKQAFVVRLGLLYQWSVIQMVMVSLILIILLASVSIWTVWAAVVSVYFSAEKINQLLSPFWTKIPEDIPVLNDVHLVTILLAGVFLIYFSLFIGKSFLKLKEKYFLITLLFCVFLFVTNEILKVRDVSAEDLFIIRNFWLGALIPDFKFHHSYPLIYWFPIVGSGFLMADLLAWSKNPQQLLKIFGIIGFLVLLYMSYEYYYISKENNLGVIKYIQFLTTYDVWNSLLLYFLSLLSFLLYISSRIQGSFKKIEKFGKIIAGGMIYNFIIITAFGKNISSWVSRYLGLPESHWVSAIILFLLGTLTSYFVECAINTRYEISLKKVSSKSNK